jgi:uncharacterized protein (UPF0264 family)
MDCRSNIAANDRLRAKSRPSLLVSVRNAADAAKALAGGADILDVKEPARGSLGRADAAAIESVADALRAYPGRVPLSVALGELREWCDRIPMRLPAEVQFAKLGLAGMRDTGDWEQEWSRIRNRLDVVSGRSFDWIAVAYADEAVADAPPLAEIIAAAIESGCRGVLIDTYDKQGSRLTELMTPAALDRTALELHEAGLILALAGRLTIADFRVIGRTACDVVAIRSAACIGEQRTQHISRERVSLCRDVLDRSADEIRNAC